MILPTKGIKKNLKIFALFVTDNLMVKDSVIC